VTGDQCCSMSQGGQWVWVTESYSCGKKGHVSGEELSSADKHQQQTEGQTIKACSIASQQMSSGHSSSKREGRPFKPAVWHHS